MTGRTHIVGVIPARYGSMRLLAKPLVEIMGKTMVERVYERASRAQLLNRVIVATDDERIVDVVERFGGEAVLTSPDIGSGSDRVAAVAEKVPGDIFVNVQGDEPLIAPEMIDEAVRIVLADDQAPVGTLARRIETKAELTNPNVVKVVLSKDSYALYFSRSIIPHVRDEQDPEKWLHHHQFYKHIGLYVFRSDFLRSYARMEETALEKAEKLEQLRILEHGGRIKVGVTEHDSIPVDTAEDVKKIVSLLQQVESR